MGKWDGNLAGTKYMMLAASSSFKGKSDLAKYDKAMKLKGFIGKIREDYTKKLSSNDKRTKQVRSLFFSLSFRLRLRFSTFQTSAYCCVVCVCFVFFSLKHFYSCCCSSSLVSFRFEFGKKVASPFVGVLLLVGCIECRRCRLPTWTIFHFYTHFYIYIFALSSAFLSTFPPPPLSSACPLPLFRLFPSFLPLSFFFPFFVLCCSLPFTHLIYLLSHLLAHNALPLISH